MNFHLQKIKNKIKRKMKGAEILKNLIDSPRNIQNQNRWTKKFIL